MRSGHTAYPEPMRLGLLDVDIAVHELCLEPCDSLISAATHPTLVSQRGEGRAAELVPLP